MTRAIPLSLAMLCGCTVDLYVGEMPPDERADADDQAATGRRMPSGRPQPGRSDLPFDDDETDDEPEEGNEPDDESEGFADEDTGWLPDGGSEDTTEGLSEGTSSRDPDGEGSGETIDERRCVELAERLSCEELERCAWYGDELGECGEDPCTSDEARGCATIEDAELCTREAPCIWLGEAVGQCVLDVCGPCAELGEERCAQAPRCVFIDGDQACFPR